MDGWPSNVVVVSNVVIKAVSGVPSSYHWARVPAGIMSDELCAKYDIQRTETQNLLRTYTIPCGFCQKPGPNCNCADRYAPGRKSR
jgi:hypothetical protein